MYVVDDTLDDALVDERTPDRPGCASLTMQLSDNRVKKKKMIEVIKYYTRKIIMGRMAQTKTHQQ